MPLYRAIVEVELVIEAEDEGEAHYEACRHAVEAIRDGQELPPYIELISDASKLKGTWAEWLECLPYGGDGKRTVRECLASE